MLTETIKYAMLCLRKQQIENMKSTSTFLPYSKKCRFVQLTNRMGVERGWGYGADEIRICHAGSCCAAEFNNVSHFSSVPIPWMMTGSAAINANSRLSKAIQLSANHFRRASRLESFSCSRYRATYFWTFSFLREPDSRELSRLETRSSLFSICGAGGTNRLFKQNTFLFCRLYHGGEREGRKIKAR